MLELIARVGTEFGIDVILSSHLLEEVERVAHIQAGDPVCAYVLRAAGRDGLPPPGPAGPLGR